MEAVEAFDGQMGSFKSSLELSARSPFLLEGVFSESLQFFLNPSFTFIFDLVHSKELVCQALEGVQNLDLSIPLQVVARSALFYIMGVQALREQM